MYISGWHITKVGYCQLWSKIPMHRQKLLIFLNFYLHFIFQVIITLVEKDGGKVYPYQFECNPFFFFHTINAFDKNNDTIVVDIMAYKNADVSSEFYELCIPFSFFRFFVAFGWWSHENVYLHFLKVVPVLQTETIIKENHAT